MFRRLCLAVCLVLAMSVVSAPGAWAYSPGTGPTFSNPYGTRAQKYAIQFRVNRMIDSTPRRGVIRIATWEIDMQSTTDKLIRAHRRGAFVRVIVQRDRQNRQFRRLQRVLGNNIHNGSFARTCGGGCRTASRGGSMHSKLYMFSRVGRSRRVIMLSSTNLSHGGARRGWNDAFTIVGNGKLYRAHRALFMQMAKDDPMRHPYRVTTSGRYRTFFFPRPGDGTRQTDTVFEALSRVRCHGARGGAGKDGRTVVRVSMFHWAGWRGIVLARKLLELDNRGCIVSVIYGAPSANVARELRRRGRHGGITVYDSRSDLNDDRKPDRYVHHKYFLVSGNFAQDRSAWRVWTGSHNWTRAALRHNDEIMLKIKSRAVHDRYRANFNQVRRTETRLVHRGSYTASTPTFKTVAPRGG